MSRLFVKIKTNPKFKGTLFEIRDQYLVGKTIDQITKSMDGLPKMDEEGKTLDYQMIRLGSPKRILEKQQTFSQAVVKNDDTLLITPDAEVVMSQGLFDFESLFLETQYASIQDTRAPLRLSPKMNSARIEHKNEKNEDGQIRSEPESSNETLLKKNGPETSFDFQPLDITLPDSEKKTGGQVSKQTRTHNNKKK